MEGLYPFFRKRLVHRLLSRLNFNLEAGPIEEGGRDGKNNVKTSEIEQKTSGDFIEVCGILRSQADKQGEWVTCGFLASPRAAYRTQGHMLARALA